MKSVRITLDEDLVVALDKATKRLGTTRSGLAREALRAALARIQDKELERQHYEGYLRNPVRRGEYSVWEAEQVWSD